MSSTTRGFNLRDLTQHGKPEIGRLSAATAQVLPATATATLFTVTGVIAVLGLVGVVTTVFSVTAVHPTLGVASGTNSSNNVAAAGTSLASTAVGSVLVMPTTLGGALPAGDTAAESITSAQFFTVNNENINITTDATNTGAVTWILSWVPLYPKGSGVSVVAA